jgi:RimJ/RimL family protein N-acetyltransferase
MDRAVAAVLAWALAPGRLGRVHAYVRADNLRSQRLLERRGLRREGTLRAYRVCRGVRHDFHVYEDL